MLAQVREGLQLNPEKTVRLADEEVFIAQLCRRADLLDHEFQSSILAVVRRHATQSSGNVCFSQKPLSQVCSLS